MRPPSSSRTPSRASRFAPNPKPKPDPDPKPNPNPDPNPKLDPSHNPHPQPQPPPEQVWRQVRKGTAQSRQRAKEMMKEWFSQPQRDNDEGYALTPALTTGPYHRPSPLAPTTSSQIPLGAPLRCRLPRFTLPQVRRHQPGAQRPRVGLHPTHGQGRGQGAVLPPDAHAHRGAWPQGGRLRGLPLACLCQLERVEGPIYGLCGLGTLVPTEVRVFKRGMSACACCLLVSQ